MDKMFYVCNKINDKKATINGSLDAEAHIIKCIGNDVLWAEDIYDYEDIDRHLEAVICAINVVREEIRSLRCKQCEAEKWFKDGE